MKEIISNLNKIFEHKTRLGIMSALMVNDTIDFNSLKTLLGCSDGKLSTNISILVKVNYISVKKKFINNKSNTSFKITPAGAKAFKSHLNALEKLLQEFS